MTGEETTEKRSRRGRGREPEPARELAYDRDPFAAEEETAGIGSHLARDEEPKHIAHMEDSSRGRGREKESRRGRKEEPAWEAGVDREPSAAGEESGKNRRKDREKEPRRGRKEEPAWEAGADREPSAAAEEEPGRTRRRDREKEPRRGREPEPAPAAEPVGGSAPEPVLDEEEVSGFSHVPVIPSTEEVEAERERLQYRQRYRRTLRSTIYALIIVAAVAVLIATLFLPVLQVSGTSMEPTLYDSDIVVLLNNSKFETGDLVGFYYQNKLLLKRVIGGPGDVIDIDEEGYVTVNGNLIDEPYVTNRSLGECDITLPYQVPENRYFVMGDNRTTSIDSRSSAIGCIEVDQIVGKVVLRVWPFSRLSLIH